MYGQGAERHREKYERWWLLKYLPDGRCIHRINLYGNSFSVVVELILDDGTRKNVVPRYHKAFRPRKSDIEVMETNFTPYCICKNPTIRDSTIRPSVKCTTCHRFLGTRKLEVWKKLHNSTGR